MTRRRGNTKIHVIVDGLGQTGGMEKVTENRQTTIGRRQHRELLSQTGIWRNWDMIKIFLVAASLLAGVLQLKNMADRIFFSKERRMLKKELERFQWLLKITNELLCLNISQKHWYQPLERKGYQNVAVYGMGELGIRLAEDIILNSSMKLLYGLDQNAHQLSLVCSVYQLEEIYDLPKPDIIVLTAHSTDDNLKRSIVDASGCEVLKIEEVIHAVR